MNARKPKGSKRPSLMMRSRISVLIAILVFLCFSIVAVRLFWMQVIKYDYYREKALNFQTKDSIIEPKRGTIYDRNYKVLAQSASTQSVLINPNGLQSWVKSKNKELEKDKADGEAVELLELEEVQEKVAKILSENLSVSYDTVLSKVKRVERQSMEIKGQVEQDIVDKIIKELQDAGIKTGAYSSVYTEPDTKRYYPYGSFASQVIGFINSSGPVGGIELEYNDILSGTAGRIVRAQNVSNSNMPFEYEQYVPAQDGGSVVLTIDESIQHYLETHIETALADNPQSRGGVSGIVMDVKTGEILGMANMPDFDINAYSTIEKDNLYYNELKAEIQKYFTENGINGEVKDEYLCEGKWAGLPNGMSDEQKTEVDTLRTAKLQAMWRNHIVSDTYEPGSTFKLMTVATALESQTISKEDTFVCNGSMMVAGWNKPIKCHKTTGHGTQTLTEALMNSCNVAMMQIAFKTTPTTFYEYFEAFGLIGKTNIDLPGETNNTSLIYTEKQLTDTPSNLAVSSFGQGFKVTPLQMISMVCAIVDDGNLKTPHIVRQILNADGSVRETTQTEIVRQVISEDTSAFMRQAMEAVVSDGTGKNAYVAGYRVGGKTATSEIEPQRDKDGNVTDLEDRYTASFIGVAPMDDPQIAVLVAIHDLPESAPHGGGAIAAPVVARILEDVLPYWGVEQSFDEENADRIEIQVSSVIGKTEDEAANILENLGFTYKTIGDGDTVTDQVPSGGVKIPTGSQVILYMGGEKSTDLITVPNVLGEHPDTAQSRLKSNNLYMRRTGIKSSQTNSQTQATSQDPAAGTQVPIGTVITVSFENTTGVSDR